MTIRRRRLLIVLVIGGLLLLSLGGALLGLGQTRSSDADRVLGILLVVVGLAALRAASWVRRSHLMTQAGIGLSAQDHQTGGSQQRGSE